MNARLRHCLAFCACVALLPAPPVCVADDGFRILRAAVRPAGQGEGHVLDADIDYRFSEPVIDALRNGVSLTLVLRIKIKREDDWLNRTVLDENRSFHVSYRALSRLYQLVYDNSETPHNFVAVKALLEAMGSIRDLPLPKALRLVPQERYRASLKVDLDIESLPLPLRPVAYVTPAWYLDSPLYQWTFVN